MKIRKSLMLAGMLGAGFVAAPSSAQVYVCMACAAGTYSDGSSTICNPCPVGNYCPAMATTPTGCPAGNYCPAGVGGPTGCPAGSYCPAGAGGPTGCPAGTYCHAGVAAPTQCTAGNYCPNGKDQVGCPAGSYCPTGAGGPTGCPAGSYCPAGAGGPTGCPAGNYCPAGAGGPIACGTNQYCPANSKTPQNCQSGTFTSNPTQPCRGADSFATIDSTIANISGSNNTSGTLQPGVYSIVIGGGNGGGAGEGFYAFLRPCTGGYGAILKYKFIVNTPTNYTLQSGANAWNAGKDASGGGAGSAFKLAEVAYVAGGGGGKFGTDTCGGFGIGANVLLNGGAASGKGPSMPMNRDGSCPRSTNDPLAGAGGGFRVYWSSGSCSTDIDSTSCPPGSEAGYGPGDRWCSGNGKASHVSNTTLGDDCNSCARLYKLR